MKHTKRLMILLLCLCLLSLWLFGAVLLPARAMEDRVSYPSMMTEEQKAEYDKLIADMQVEEKYRKKFEESYQTYVGGFDRIIFGTDKYVLEYHFSEKFCEIEGDVEKAFFSKLSTDANVHIPVYTEISSECRFVGSVLLVHTEQGYVPHTTMCLSVGEPDHPLLRIGTVDAVKAMCAERGLTDVKDVLSVSLGKHLEDSSDRIAVVQTSNGRYVLEYGFAPYVSWQEPTLYTFEEFAKVYAEEENRRPAGYFGVDTGTLGRIFGAIGDFIFGKWLVYFVCVLILFIAVGIAVLILYRRHKKRKKES